MAHIVSFVGNSESGKTTLLTKVVSELKRRGYRVAVIKHAPHGFEIDQPGKDTWRLAQARGDVVAISSPEKMAFVERVDTELTLAQIEALIGAKADIVLAEGYKNSNAAKVLVLSGDPDAGSVRYKGELLATVSARSSSLGRPQFEHNNIIGVVDLLIARLNGNSGRKLKDFSRIDTLLLEYDAPQSDSFEALLAESVTIHGHICPGQVLGIRMALRGCSELSIQPRKESKRLIVYVEIDRCATDAIQVVTGCKLGKRTLKYVDYGKLAATFVDLHTGNAVRVVARATAREKAGIYSCQGRTKYEAEVAAYQAMTDDELFRIERVVMKVPSEDMPGPPLHRIICDQCGEEVNDYREVLVAGKVLCRPCAYGGYYQPCNEASRKPVPHEAYASPVYWPMDTIGKH